MEYKKITIVLVALLLAASMPVLAGQKEVVGEATPLSVDHATYVDANSILMFVTNTGALGRDLSDVFGYDAGTFYPFTTTEAINDGSNTTSPLYAAGLWMGGKVGGEIRVAMAEFAQEFWPGPMSGGTFIADADTVSSYRVYKLYADSLAGNPNQDYAEWPTADGAPVDRDGHPLSMGDQTLWSVFNDANPAQHVVTTGGSTAPLGVEVHQTVWSSDAVGEEAVIYVMYKMFNKGGNDIDDFYVSFWMDADLGWASDDVFGCDTLDNVIYCYNGDNNDSSGGTAHYGVTPPAVGAKVLAGPVEPSMSDTASFCGYELPDFVNLNMTGFQIYGGGGFPCDPDSAWQTYNIMMGMEMDSAVAANGTRFHYPGDPVTGTGDIDTLPSEKKMLVSFGPLDFNPGDSQQLVVKMAVGQDADRLSSLTALRDILNASSMIPTGVSDNNVDALPSSFRVSQNYPNPFNPSTTIGYSLPNRADVAIEIFNVLGQKITTVFEGTKPAGDHTAVWNGTNDAGKPVSSGVYFYRVSAGDHTQTKKMMMVK